MAMRKVFKLLLDLNEEEGYEFEKELDRLKIGKIDLFRLAWAAYKQGSHRNAGKCKD